MKKILHTLLLTVLFQTTFGHIAQNGPLTLGDQVQKNNVHLVRGVIMNTLLTNPDLAQDLNNIYQFLGIPRTVCLPSYEEIVDTAEQSIYCDGAIQVIEAFEKAIMKYLHYKHYLFYVQGKTINIFFTGIKYSWFYPSEWMNIDSWLSSNNSSEIRQLIDELEELSNIASKHSIATSVRLQAKIHSYRNWKQNTLKCMGALGTIAAAVYIKNKCL